MGVAVIREGRRREEAGELEAEFAEEINRSSEVLDDDSYVVHPFERHVSNLQGVV